MIERAGNIRSMASGEPRHIEVIVQVSEPTDDLLTRLRRAGLEVDHVLGSVGVVTGWVDGVHLAGLSEVAGVARVEVARRVAALHSSP
jgi:hypothetical protein